MRKKTTPMITDKPIEKSSNVGRTQDLLREIMQEATALKHAGTRTSLPYAKAIMEKTEQAFSILETLTDRKEQMPHVENESSLLDIFEHPAIIGLSTEKIPFRVEGNCIVLGGFSKSGSVDLRMEKDGLKAHARYNEVTPIETFDDIVNLAWDWFVRYNDREPFKQPDPIWVDEFCKRGLLKKQTQVIFEIQRCDGHAF